MSKTKTATKKNGKPEIADEDADMLEGGAAPQLQEDMSELEPIPGTGTSQVKVNAATLFAELHEAGIEIKHEGGSLPKLEFDPVREVGKTVVFRWAGIARASEDAEFDMIVMDMLDWQRFKTTGDAQAAFSHKLQLASTTALKGVFGETAKPDMQVEEKKGSASLGEIYALTYGGEISTRRGQSKLKLYTVTRLTLSAKFKRPVVAAVA